MRKAILTFVVLPLSLAAQTTVTIPSTVSISNIDRPGMNLGGLASYGSAQIFKSLNYANGGYMPGTYFQTTFPCSTGTQTTTQWYNNNTNSPGFPVNFWVGATFIAYNAANGATYGTGTITASTTNNINGITLTMSPAISSACSQSQGDLLMVKLTALNTLTSPNSLTYGQICSSATWDTTDTDPASTNTQQSLEMPTGCTAGFGLDQVVGNSTNTNSSLASTSTPWLNLNGSYTLTFKAKCLVSGCSMSYVMGRNSGTNFVPYTVVNPSYSATPGVGWTTYTYPFTASETGAQQTGLYFSISCTGTCLMQDADVIEGSTLAGNTTVFRDAVVYELQKLKPGSIRYMDGTQWCSDVADEIAATGNRRFCGFNGYLPQIGYSPIGYNDVLQLANLIGSDAWISVGILNQPSDWTALVNWLSTSGWISTFAGTGHKIYLEDGNEAWNSGAGPPMFAGDGVVYGATLGGNMAAAKAATGYNSSVIQLVGSSWISPNQGYGAYGWLATTLSHASCTTGTQSGCPNFMDVAPYKLNYLQSFTSSGSNVSTTGAPFLDEWAEDVNYDSVTSPAANAWSTYLVVQSTKSYGLGTTVYEANESTNLGTESITQLQLNQMVGSVGNGLSMAEDLLLMQRDAQVTGPLNVFVLAQNSTNYDFGGSPQLAAPLWGVTRMMSTGPGQSSGFANVDRPSAIALEVIDNAIGSNNNLIATSQSGTPTFSYAGGQSGAGYAIAANSTVPYVNCFAYANNAQTSWTAICFNNNLSSTESVTLSGAGAPSGSVTQTVFPASANIITDNNENTYLGPSSIAPVVNYPSSTTTSGTSYTIPAASMMVLTYGTSGTTYNLTTSTSGTGSGSVSGTNCPATGLSAGASYSCTATASGGSTFTNWSGSTCGGTRSGATYSGTMPSTNCNANAVFTLNGTLPTPTFSPVGGTYSVTQMVTITIQAGATGCYTTDGSTPLAAIAGTCSHGSTYSGPLTVSTSQVIKVLATEVAYTNSGVGTATYTISPITSVNSKYLGFKAGAGSVIH